MMTQEEFTDVLAMKRRGMSFREIGDELGYHPATIAKQELPPRLTVAIDRVGPHRLDDLPNKQITELILAAAAVQTKRLRSPCNGGPSCGRPGTTARSNETPPRQPQPELLGHRTHGPPGTPSPPTDPTDRNAAREPVSSTGVGGSPRKWSHDWRTGWSHNWRWDGPRPLAQPNSRWSHPAGGRHLELK